MLQEIVEDTPRAGAVVPQYSQVITSPSVIGEATRTLVDPEAALSGVTSIVGRDRFTFTFLATNSTLLNVNTVPCESSTGENAEIDVLGLALTPGGSEDSDDARLTVAGSDPLAVRVKVAVYDAITTPS